MLGGDGWTYCDRGHRHWGRHGAAGLLLTHRDPGGALWLLLQHRAWWSHHGDTWGLLGGARARGESAADAAAREAAEEAALSPSTYRLGGSYVDDHGRWSYTTVSAHAEEMVPVTRWCEESERVAWVRADALDELALHPGFAASWPEVRALAA